MIYIFNTFLGDITFYREQRVSGIYEFDHLFVITVLEVRNENSFSALQEKVFAEDILLYI